MLTKVVVSVVVLKMTLVEPETKFVPFTVSRTELEVPPTALEGEMLVTVGA